MKENGISRDIYLKLQSETDNILIPSVGITELKSKNLKMTHLPIKLKSDSAMPTNKKGILESMHTGTTTCHLHLMLKLKGIKLEMTWKAIMKKVKIIILSQMMYIYIADDWAMMEDGIIVAMLLLSGSNYNGSNAPIGKQEKV